MDRETIDRDADSAPGGEPDAAGQDGADDLLEQIFAMLCAVLPELAAAPPARIEAVKRLIRIEYAGDRVYLRKRTVVLRRADVFARFNGRNATEVARELGISRATVYRLLKQPGR